MSKTSLNDLYESCTLCPRACGVNRLAGETGVCGETAEIRIACACIHFGEEPPITGTDGSGTVFFSGCTLGCPFCQNCQISRDGVGGAISVEELAAIFLALENKGASNVNLVTGTHFTPGIIGAIVTAKEKGLRIPFVWNSSGYEETDTLRLLARYVDIWLPDAKTHDPRVSVELFGVENYPQKNKSALLFMAENATTEYNGELLRKGVIVRHLILPGETKSTEEVLRWFKSHIYGKAMLSLMCQYIPVSPVQASAGSGQTIELGNCVTKDQYDDCLFLLDELGIDEGFIQEQCNDLEWRPDFTRLNPFPEEFTKPVWHYISKYV